jgi:hypothetical protein
MAAGFYSPLAARLSPQLGGKLLLPLLTQAQQLRQGETMYLSSSKRVASLTLREGRP